MSGLLSLALGALGLGKLQAIVLAILLAACGTLWLLYDGAAARRDLAQIERDQALALNADNLRALDAIGIAHAREVEALATERNAAVARGERTRIIIRKVMDAPKSSTCVGSPAVRAYFDGLRGQARPGPDSGGASPGQPGASPLQR